MSHKRSLEADPRSEKCQSSFETSHHVGTAALASPSERSSPLGIGADCSWIRSSFQPPAPVPRIRCLPRKHANPALVPDAAVPSPTNVAPQPRPPPNPPAPSIPQPAPPRRGPRNEPQAAENLRRRRSYAHARHPARLPGATLRPTPWLLADPAAPAPANSFPADEATPRDDAGPQAPPFPSRVRSNPKAAPACGSSDKISSDAFPGPWLCPHHA